MAKRQSFYTRERRPEDDAARMRDLEALLVPRRVAFQDIPIDRIAPNPFQARQRFEGLDELAASIVAQGFITRLRLRLTPGSTNQFQLVFGERRLRAAQIAGLTAVPCEIAPHTDEEMLEMGLAENIQRENLDPLEEAEAFRLYIDKLNYSTRRLAERLGKDVGYINNRLALLRTPTDVQDMVRQRPDSIRAARDIARLTTPEERAPLIQAVVQGRLNSTQVREYTSADHAAFAVAQFGSDEKTIHTLLSRWLAVANDPVHKAELNAPLGRLLTMIEQITEALQSE